MLTRASRQAFRITLVYVIVAGAWTLGSNALLKRFALNLEEGLDIEVIKDWGFMVLMGAGLFHLLRRWLGQWETEVEQRKAAEHEFRRTQRALKTISACNGVLVRATNEATLLTEICRVVVEQGGHRLAWVGFAENDEDKSVGIAARAGCDEGYLEESRISWDDTLERGRGPTGKAIRTGEIVVCNDFQTDPLAIPLRAGAARHGFASNIVLPLRLAEKTFGVLTIYSAAAQAFNSTEVELLNELAKDLAFGIQALRTQMERTKAEQSRRAAEEKYRRVFESARDAISTLDPITGKYISGNPAAVAMFGVKSEAEYILHGPGDFSPERQPDGGLSAEAVQAFNEKLMQEGQQFFEWKHRRLNGEEFMADVLLTHMEQDGQPLVLATVRDITQRKQAEATLRESEQRYRQLFELESDAVVLVDCETRRFVDVNQSAQRLYGYSRDELLKLGPEDVSAEREKTSATVASGQFHVPLRWHRRKNGELFAVEITANQIEDQGRRIELATLRDITVRQRVMEMLQETTGQLLEAQRIAGLGSYMFDAKTGHWTSSEALDELFGIVDPGITKDVASWLQLVHPEDRAEMERYLQEELFQGHGTFDRTYRIIHQQDRQERWVHGLGKLVLDEQGQVAQMVGTIQDITQAHQLEAQLRQSQKMEAIGQLAGGVAHDFNNILASLIMQADLIEMAEFLPAEVTEGLKQIRADAMRAAQLTRQLLLFGRRQVMQSCLLDLNGVVTNLAKMLQRIIGEDVRLQLKLHPVPLMTRADAGMVEQVLMNLAVNARDAMPQGGRLGIETAEKIVAEELAGLYPDARPGRYVCFSVSDTGSGIPPEILPQIFEPFFTTKPAGKGTGLGLATVFGIVKQHQGWLKVDNQPGQGVTFRVFLPTSTVPADEAAQTEAKSRPQGGSETILLVEDEAQVRKSLGFLLERRGYQVVAAANGAEALDLWRTHRGKVALLLTDLVMPGGMTGYELARQLQSGQSKLKTIYMSGYSAEIAGREIELRPGEVYLQKPCGADQLFDTIRRSLDG
jgi:PAS domain S-box-containing protein